jgi:hypothetical protein
MAKKKVKTKRSAPQPSRKPAARQPRRTGKAGQPVARWTTADGRRLLALENAHFRVEVWPDMGAAIVSHVDLATGIDIMWRNPYGQPPRATMVDQPIGGGSDLYDVMDGSWYVSLPTGFFPTSYFGAPIGTHGELRALPWPVQSIESTPDELTVTFEGRSVRTPLVYRRALTVKRGSAKLFWRETLINRSAQALPVAWLQHPTFGGPLLDGARLIVPAKTVKVFQADDPSALQLQAGYVGAWPFVPERETGKMRDCSVVPPAGSGKDHSVQMTDLAGGWGCVWNEQRGLGYAMEWELEKFPYAWSWNCSGGHTVYPLWGEGHIITLQPSTSPVGRFPDLVKAGAVLTLPPRGSVSTWQNTGFVKSAEGPWREQGES